MGALAPRRALRLLAPRLLAWCALPSSALAHRLDEYLQATLVSIEPTDIRLSINLTPGIEVADEVLAQIDWNRDGAISASEEATYAELLRRDLVLRLDEDAVELHVVAVTIPLPGELRTGEGIIMLELGVKPAALAPGRHVLAIENRHFRSIGVYLLNAALPSSRTIAIARQTRNDEQSAGEIEFTVAPTIRGVPALIVRVSRRRRGPLARCRRRIRPRLPRPCRRWRRLRRESRRSRRGSTRRRSAAGTCRPPWPRA